MHHRALQPLQARRRAVPQGRAKGYAAEVDGALLQRSARDARARFLEAGSVTQASTTIALASDLPSPGFVAPVGWRPPYAARPTTRFTPAKMIAGAAPRGGSRMAGEAGVSPFPSRRPAPVALGAGADYRAGAQTRLGDDKRRQAALLGFDVLVCGNHREK